MPGETSGTKKEEVNRWYAVGSLDHTRCSNFSLETDDSPVLSNSSICPHLVVSDSKLMAVTFTADQEKLVNKVQL